MSIEHVCDHVKSYYVNIYSVKISPVLKCTWRRDDGGERRRPHTDVSFPEDFSA